VAAPPLAVHATGSGAAILLLHAFPLDSSQWDHQVAVLSETHRCLRPDFWGCGSSAPLERPLEASLDAYAEALVETLEREAVSPLVAVGSSMGGYAALALLRRAPARVRALVLASSRATADTPEQSANRRRMAEIALRDGAETAVPMANRLLGPAAREEPHIRDAVEGRIRRCRPEGIAACQSAMAARPDSTELLGSIRVPTLVVAGDHDGIVSRDEASAMAAALPRGELALIAGAGHLANLEDPPAFTETLLRFLAALPTPG
jgi:3-oxoadipate enol-lactonase